MNGGRLACITSIAETLVKVIDNINSPSHVWMSVAVVIHHIRPRVIWRYSQYGCSSLLCTFKSQSVAELFKSFDLVV